MLINGSNKKMFREPCEGAIDQGAFPGGIGIQRRELKTFLKTYQLFQIRLHGIARLRAWFQTKEAPVSKVENENDSIVHLSACCHPIQVTALWAFQMIKKKWRFTVAIVQKYQPEKDFLQFRSTGFARISSKLL